MANEDVRPSAISGANWTGAYTDIDEDYSSPDGTCVYTATTGATLTISMATPSGDLSTATNAQEVAIYLRKFNTSGTEDNGGGDPLYTLEVSTDNFTESTTLATDIAITGATGAT